MKIRTIQTGYTLVSSAVPDRTAHKSKLAYTRLFQSKKSRIKVPVKCYYAAVGTHRVLIDAGWSKEVAEHPIRHLGFGLHFASEPVMKLEEAAVSQLRKEQIDCILMTHLDCDHISGVTDFPDIEKWCSKEEYEKACANSLRYGKLLKGNTFNYLDFKEDAKAPFGRSADLFGDGTIIAYFTPTHSAGSVIYKIVEDEKYYLIVGDNGYMDRSWEEIVLPGPLYHEDNMRKCLKWIRKKSMEEECLGILCAHNPKEDLLGELAE